MRKVVRTFEILTEEQLIRITNPPPAPVSTDAPLATSNANSNGNSNVNVNATAAEMAAQPPSAVQSMPVQVQSLPPLPPLK